MTKLYKIATPIPADSRFVEACQEIFAVTCERRAIVEIAGDRIDLYFEQLSDAKACVDLVEALTMDRTPDSDSPSVQTSGAGHGGRL